MAEYVLVFDSSTGKWIAKTGGLVAAQIADGAVTSGKIPAGAIGQGHLDPNIVIPTATLAQYLQEATYLSAEAIVSNCPVYMSAAGLMKTTQIAAGMPAIGVVPAGVASGIAALVRFAGICPGDPAIISGQKGSTIFTGIGAVTLTSPTTSGKVSQILGHVFDNSNLFLQINMTTVDIAG